jgi:uncharacterized protein with ATP-grasp and redox domains
MRTYLDCVPCFLRQALDAARRVTDDERIHESLVRQTLQLAATMAFDRPPPWMGQQIHRMLRDAVGQQDPYRQAKHDANRFALQLLPGLRRKIEAAPNPFGLAVRIAIAGNIVDLGVKSELPQRDVDAALNEAMTDSVDATALERLERRARGARSILYLADNAGEIVFDRLLIERLPMDRVTVAVKKSPVINDATREDAAAAGLTDLVEVVDNGSDAPGTILDQCSLSFQRRFAEADLVIAKGQGNYETLNNVRREVFFLLKVKCRVIARDIGCPVGRIVLHRHAAASPDERVAARRAATDTEARDELPFRARVRRSRLA